MGILPALKNNANQVKIGRACTKNCEVSGIKKQLTNAVRIKVLIIHDAGNITYTNSMISDKNE